MTHPTILYFQQRAATLSLKGDNRGLDEALVLLAAWMDASQDQLGERDWAALGEVGAILYREGLKRSSQT